jgi:hypothetical protein
MLFTYNVSPNDGDGDWYWEITNSGEIVARGLANAQAQARADCIAAIVLHGGEPKEDFPWPRSSSP